MELKYVPIEFDWFHETQDLNAAEKGRLMDGLMAYAMGEDPEQYLTGQERLIFRHYQRKVDTLRESVAQKTETQSRNGSKGGRPRTQKPKNPPLNSVSDENPKKQYKKEIENKIKNENEIENKDYSILTHEIDRSDSFYYTGTPTDDVARVLDAWEALEIGPAGDAETILQQTQLADRLDENGLTMVLDALEEVSRSDYLMGRDNGPPAKFEWLMRPDIFDKVVSGFYRTACQPRGQDPPKPSFDPGRAEHLRAKEAAKCV